MFKLRIYIPKSIKLCSIGAERKFTTILRQIYVATTLFAAPNPLDARACRAYNPLHEIRSCDHYPNYIPGALKAELPGKGV